jgi:ferredoxin
MKITADAHTCVGSGQCVMHAPKLFDQDEETGLVVVLRPVVTGEDILSAQQAERSCPVSAITLDV